MKNKGRKHLGNTLDCKGWLMGITRDIRKMGRPTLKGIPKDAYIIPEHNKCTYRTG